MTKVYVVTATYLADDGWNIVGVFSTLEAAKACSKAKNNRWTTTDIQLWEIDGDELDIP